MQSPVFGIAETVSDLDSRLLGDIEVCAANAYQRTAPLFPEHDPDILHTRGICTTMSRFMVANLARLGYDSGVVTGRPNAGKFEGIVDEKFPVTTLRSLFHKYPVINLSGRKIIADPTWQQMLEPEVRTPDLPRVLIATPYDFRRYLTEPRHPSGQPLIDNPYVLGFWLPSKSPK